MNYGKNFIITYNKEFSAFRKELILRIERDYDSPEMDSELYSKYNNEIHGKINELKENDNNGELSSSLTGISLGYMSKQYKFDRIENIINRNVYSYFLSHQKYSKYESFISFLEFFSKSLTLHNYSDFLRNNSNEFYYFLDKKDVKNFFKIKYVKDDLNQLVADKKNVKIENSNNNIEIEVLNLKEEKKNYNPFSNNQKFILLNAFISCLQDDAYEIPDVESLSILKISSSALIDLPLAKNYGTEYKKFSKGVNYSKKNNREKKNELIIIREECLKLELIEISKYLTTEIRKL